MHLYDMPCVMRWPLELLNSTRCLERAVEMVSPIIGNAIWIWSLLCSFLKRTLFEECRSRADTSHDCLGGRGEE